MNWFKKVWTVLVTHPQAWLAQEKDGRKTLVNLSEVLSVEVSKEEPTKLRIWFKNRQGHADCEHDTEEQCTQTYYQLKEHFQGVES